MRPEDTKACKQAPAETSTTVTISRIKHALENYHGLLLNIAAEANCEPYPLALQALNDLRDLERQVFTLGYQDGLRAAAAYVKIVPVKSSNAQVTELLKKFLDIVAGALEGVSNA